MLAQKHYLYEMKYNPVVMYEYRLQSSAREPGAATPEEVVKSDEFKKMIMEHYSAKCAEQLDRGDWFKKVDALEEFTDLWTWGRSLTQPPKEHNVYVPVTQTILPRPRLTDDWKQDQIGKDFSYLMNEERSPQRAIVDPVALKPAPFSPRPPPRDYAEYAHQHYQRPRQKFNMPYRLNQKKSDKMKVLNYPLKFRFSSAVQPLSEAEEARRIQEFEQAVPSNKRFFGFYFGLF